ncbi:sorbosone dehydrogenase family protein [Bradyrhizobium sp. sBnM-33]|uniref:PQQ-dependent sugar dehydrogenase n=1 Tax=Bradyrhizobium sp. sBnM-33 TaxID=2831780 RepID=UPI001BCB4368|nr:PQQ-dependent sugar dehydrogenase [Bradyrhizobium sp. sBnM-33]WOH51680.1 PQQ-dependent sugar dehydrogenase [Bradyrhizobium sp. sBnM-33]
MKIPSSRLVTLTAALVAIGFALAPAWAQRRSAPAAQPPAEKPTDPALLPDQELGRRFTVKAEDLPPPKTGPIVSSRSLVIPHDGQTPRVPEGFTTTAFMTGLEHPRRLLVLPNGDVLLAEQKAGYLTLLRDEDGDGKADWIQRHAEGFNQPYGLAWRDDHVLVADQDGIWKVPHRLGALRAGRGGEQPKAADVPPDQRKPSPAVVGEEMITRKGVFGIVQGHTNRHLAIDPKTGGLFVGVGSSGNVGVEPEVKATIQRFDPDGANQATFASGLRNPTALAFEPGTGDLYAVVQERDGLGDRLPPDYLTRVEKGAFYGWPYAYIGQHPQPGFAKLKPDKVKASIKPDLLFEAHSSAMDLVFYDGEQFPPEFRGGAFVALKGSWNRSEPTGYKIVFVPFKDGRPQGWYQNFAVGFWVSGMHRAEIWGRPAALAIAKDGSLLVADDTGGTIWRIAYTGPQNRAGKPDGNTEAPR